MDLKYIKNLREESVGLTEVSKYDAVLTYYRSLGLDPYKLRGKVGAVLRAKIKNSPAFHAWAKIHHYESVSINGDAIGEAAPTDVPDEGAKGSKSDKDGKVDDTIKTNIDTVKLGGKGGNNSITFYGYPGANTSSEANRPDETEINFNSPTSTNI